jgi:hypothetical protein
MTMLFVLVSPASNSQVTSTSRSAMVLSDAQSGSELADLGDRPIRRMRSFNCAGPQACEAARTHGYVIPR